eukprot:scaffold295719_cov49-Prasinocladus_malaysianus.AAC.2
MLLLLYQSQQAGVVKAEAIYVGDRRYRISVAPANANTGSHLPVQQDLWSLMCGIILREAAYYGHRACIAARALFGVFLIDIVIVTVPFVLAPLLSMFLL